MTPLKPLLISLLRTFVSWAWALVIGWLLVAMPIFQPFEESLLGLAELALPVLVSVIAATWYAFWRWLEPRLPDWLTRAVLGSAKAPLYVSPAGPLDRVPGADHRV